MSAIAVMLTGAGTSAACTLLRVDHTEDRHFKRCRHPHFRAATQLATMCNSVKERYLIAAKFVAANPEHVYESVLFWPPPNPLPGAGSKGSAAGHVRRGWEQRWTQW